MAEKPEEYKWSSYPDYIGDRKIHEWLNRDFILGYFGNKVPAAERKYKISVCVNNTWRQNIHSLPIEKIPHFYPFLGDVPRLGRV